MKRSISKASLRSGLWVFVIIILLLLSRAGSFTLLAIYVVPGFVYGLTLLDATEKTISVVLSTLFNFLSVIINALCVYFISNDIVDIGHVAPLKLISASAFSAVLLTAAYDLLLVRRFSLFNTIAMPAIMGIAASLSSVVCMNLSDSDKYDDFGSTILEIGVFSIFPLWQYLVGLNIEYHNRSVALVELVEKDGQDD